MENLKLRTQEALEIVRKTRNVFGDLGLVNNERTQATIPLILASIDAADSIFSLFINQPERSWAIALMMQRAQMEYVLRAAFFAKAANSKQVQRFLSKGKMPSKGKHTIYISDVAAEAAMNLGWDKEILKRVVKNHFKDLSGLVHGGKEVIGIYTLNGEMGNIEIEWDHLLDSVVNILVFAQLGLAVAMTLSPLSDEEISKIASPVYDAAHKYFDSLGVQKSVDDEI